MSESMLSLVQQVAGELNLAVPTYVKANPSQDVQQILALMNAAGKNILRETTWQAMAKVHQFYTQDLQTTATSASGSYILTGIPSTAGLEVGWAVTGYNVPQNTTIESIDSATQVTLSQQCSISGSNNVVFSKVLYDMPVDFLKIENSTQWDSSKRWVMLGPMTPQQWAWLLNGFISTGPRIRWRIRNNQFEIWPPGNTNDFLYFEYTSKGWATTAAGVPQNQLANDDDTTVFDDELMVVATKLKYFQTKGFDTTSLQQNYDRILSIVKANDKGAATLSFAPRINQTLLGWNNVPDQGYGS